MKPLKHKVVLHFYFGILIFFVCEKRKCKLTQHTGSCRKLVWTLLLITGRKCCLEFPEQLIIRVLEFLGYPALSFVGRPDFQRRDFIPMVNISQFAFQCHQPPEKSAGLRAEAVTGISRKPQRYSAKLLMLQEPHLDRSGVVSAPHCRCSQLIEVFASLPPSVLSLTGERCHRRFISCGAVIWGSCGASSAARVIRDAVGGTSTGRCSQQQSCCNDASKPVSWLLLSDGAVRPRGRCAALSMCFPAWACDEISLCAAFRPWGFHGKGCLRTCLLWKCM